MYLIKSCMWVGTEYYKSSKRILVLGESRSIPHDHLSLRIVRWCKNKQTDATLSRIFDTISDAGETDLTSSSNRIAVMRQYCFLNLVPILDTSDSGATYFNYVSALGLLDTFVSRLNPQGVWILGEEHAGYSKIILDCYDLKYETIPHPASEIVTQEEMKKSWQRLQAKLNLHQFRTSLN